MTFLVVVIILAGIGSAYWFLLRPVLRQRAELAAFFNKSDIKRASWLAKIKLGVAGLRTKLLAKAIAIGGLFLPMLSMVTDGSFDLSTMLPAIHVTSSWQIAPTQYVPMALVPLVAWVVSKLRDATTTPVGVPSEVQVAAIMPNAPAKVIAAKTAEIAESKAPPSAAEGKD